MAASTILEIARVTLPDTRGFQRSAFIFEWRDLFLEGTGEEDALRTATDLVLCRTTYSVHLLRTPFNATEKEASTRHHGNLSWVHQCLDLADHGSGWFL